MKQTAVEWLMEQITYDNGFGQRRNSYIDSFDLSEFFKQAKELEKRHIMDANTAGVNCGLYGYKNAEEYYKKTFTEPTRITNDNINVTNK